MPEIDQLERLRNQGGQVGPVICGRVCDGNKPQIGPEPGGMHKFLLQPLLEGCLAGFGHFAEIHGVQADALSIVTGDRPDGRLFPNHCPGVTFPLQDHGKHGPVEGDADAYCPRRDRLTRAHRHKRVVRAAAPETACIDRQALQAAHRGSLDPELPVQGYTVPR